MEIIERGTPPSDAIHVGTCWSCRTKVRFKRSEGKITYDQCDGDTVSVRCPVCGGYISSRITYASLR